MRGLKSCFLTKNTFAHLINSHYGCWFTDPKIERIFWASSRQHVCKIIKTLGQTCWKVYSKPVINLDRPSFIAILLLRGDTFQPTVFLRQLARDIELNPGQSCNGSRKIVHLGTISLHCRANFWSPHSNLKPAASKSGDNLLTEHPAWRPSFVKRRQHSLGSGNAYPWPLAHLTGKSSI